MFIASKSNVKRVMCVTEQSVSIRATANGIAAGERFERYKFEAFTEVVLRAAGILMVMGAFSIWFLAPSIGIGGYSYLISLAAAIGLVVFAFGTRGFQRQVEVDMEKGTLSLTKININGQARITRNIDLGAIQSVFLQKPTDADGDATLLVRVSGSNSPAIALSGELREVERVHEELCNIMRLPDRKKKPSVRLVDEQMDDLIIPM